MPEEKRGKLGLILAILFSLAVVSIIALYGVYWAALNKEDIETVKTSGGVGTTGVGKFEMEPEVRPTGTTESGVRRLRSLLLSRLPEGETVRFTRVFDELEIAAREGRIDKTRFDAFPDILKIALADGEIDFDEHEILLDNLEASIIPREDKK